MHKFILATFAFLFGMAIPVCGLLAVVAVMFNSFIVALAAIAMAVTCAFQFQSVMRAFDRA